MKKILTLILMLAVLTGCAAQETIVEETAETSVMTSLPNETIVVERVPDEAEFYELRLYTQKGTGKKKPEDFELPTEYYSVYLKTEKEFPYITTINDKAIQSKINEWIDDACERTEEKKRKLEKRAESDTSINYINDVSVKCYCINGYLEASVDVGYGIADENVGYAEGLIYYSEKAYFDLYTGEQLEFSDLFYEDVDYITYYNKLVEEKTLHPMQFEAFGTIIMPQKREFSGITEDGVSLGLRYITFNKDNPYFTEGFGILMDTYSDYLCENAVIYEPRDMEGLLNREVDREEIEWSDEEDAEVTYAYGGAIGNVIIVSEISESTFLSDGKIDEINSFARELIGDEEVRTIVKNCLGKEFGDDMYTEDGRMNEILMYIGVNREENYFSVALNKYNVTVFDGQVEFFYNIDTMERMTNEEIFTRCFGEDWREECKLRDNCTYEYCSIEELADNPESAQVSVKIFGSNGEHLLRIYMNEVYYDIIIKEDNQ